MRAFHRFSDLFDVFRSRAEAARALGIKDGTLRKYATGARPFPITRVDDLVAALHARPGGEGVTHALVCRLAAAAIKGAREAA